jgi:putative ABC transport system permease protein
MILRLIRESFIFALHNLLANKLQTTLSLLGITIGIFSVISVFTLVDSLESKIRSSIDSFGSEIIYVQKWPWIFGDFPWWKYYQRPDPNLKDAEYLRRNLKNAQQVGFMVSTSKRIEYGDATVESVEMVASSPEYDLIFDFELQEGRYFSANEFSGGRPGIILGALVAESLFGNAYPIGKKVKIFGQKVPVIGVFKKQGEDILNNSHDNRVLIPINYARNVINLRYSGLNPSLMVIGKDKVSPDQIKDEIKVALRSLHHLKPQEDDDFSLNEISILKSGFDGIFKTIGIAGWFIGGLSLLVGGFGIANIMFVSVKERTSQIGIQKALGAKNFFVLLQFLFESVFLSLMGGIVGLILVYGGVLIAQYGYDFPLILSLGNISTGIFVSLGIGLVAGLIPAWLASQMSPVEAIRSV